MSRGRESSAAVRVARALGDATRFELLRHIAARGEICCRDLTALSRLSQATISHHLRILSEAGLVTSRRAGQFSYFRMRPGALAAHGRSLENAFHPSSPRRRRGRGERRPRLRGSPRRPGDTERDAPGGRQPAVMHEERTT